MSELLSFYSALRICSKIFFLDLFTRIGSKTYHIIKTLLLSIFIVAIYSWLIYKEISVHEMNPYKSLICLNLSVQVLNILSSVIYTHCWKINEFQKFWKLVIEICETHKGNFAGTKWKESKSYFVNFIAVLLIFIINFIIDTTICLITHSVERYFGNILQKLLQYLGTIVILQFFVVVLTIGAILDEMNRRLIQSKEAVKRMPSHFLMLIKHYNKIYVAVDMLSQIFGLTILTLYLVLLASFVMTISVFIKYIRLLVSEQDIPHAVAMDLANSLASILLYMVSMQNA